MVQNRIENPTAAKSKKPLIILVVLIVLVGGGLLGYKLMHKKPVTPAPVDTLTSLKKIYSLPENVTPTIATIEDAAKIKAKEVFFTNAQNGDKLIVYPDQAIIFRPSTNQIINSSSITEKPGIDFENNPGLEKTTTKTK